MDDLNRQLIKSDSCTLFIPSIDLEIPPGTQRGTISTIEGFLLRAAYNLEENQPERLRLGDVDNFHRCRLVIQQLRKLAGHGEADVDSEEVNVHEVKSSAVCSTTFQSFDIILDDPAGNSFIENPFAPKDDPFVTKTSYLRSPMQDLSLGLQPSKEALDAGYIDESNPAHSNPNNTVPEGKHVIDILPHKIQPIDDNSEREPESVGNLGKQEALRFPTVCASCYKEAETTMCVTDIPHFKEVVIMSLLCDQCGYKSNEIKGGGAIPKFGTRIILTVKTLDDLQREVLKSDTAGFIIPEIELELQEGSLDGLYTTVEGLLDKLYSRLESANPFHVGDAAKKQHEDNDGGAFSAPRISAQRYMDFLIKLSNMKEGKSMPFTIIISDPLSNSFVGPIPADAIALALQTEREGNNSCYTSYIDHGMLIEEYERSFEQNEVLGLNDMKTENYDDGVVNNKYYATDIPEELPDRLRRLDHRGPDHPYAVAKAPVEGDTMVMGAGSNNFATPSLGQRGKFVLNTVKGLVFNDAEVDAITRCLLNFENDDSNFMMSETFDGRKEGMAYKMGKQGLGYYTDVSLDKLINLEQES